MGPCAKGDGFIPTKPFILAGAAARMDRRNPAEPVGRSMPISPRNGRSLSINPSPNLEREASRHACRVQAAIGLVALTLDPISQLVTACVTNDTVSGVVFMASLTGVPLLMSMHAAWSAIWLVLGGGRWWARLLGTLGIFEITAGLVVGLAAITRQPMELDDAWRDSLAMFSAASYVFSTQLVVNSLWIWLLKMLRYRLVYFCNAAAYPHPRAANRDAFLNDDNGLMLRGRVSIADMLVLTAWVALCLGSYYPLEHFVFSRNDFFGPSFVFTIVAVALGISAVIALPMILLTLVIAMLDHRGKRFQILVHTTVYGIGCLAGGWLIWKGILEDEAIFLVVIAAIAVAVHESILVFLLRQPSRWFRFRLIRIPGKGSQVHHAP